MSPDPRDPRDYERERERELDRERQLDRERERDRELRADAPVRERIERRTIIRETPRSGGGGAAFGVGALIVLLLVAVGAFLWWNSRHNPAGFGANPASTSSSSTSSTSGTPGYGDNATGSATDNPMAQGAGPFGIAVGSYNDESGAVSERQRLDSLTDQPVTLSQTNDNGTTTYRVVVGSFATRSEADSAGRSLATVAGLSNWQVVPIQQ